MQNKLKRQYAYKICLKKIKMSKFPEFSPVLKFNFARAGLLLEGVAYDGINPAGTPIDEKIKAAD